MQKKPLVSVVMPVFNAGKYLPKSIESILNQSLKNFEFIIVNDASTDKTLQSIQKYKKDKRVKVINNKENIHMAESLNLGVKQAKSNIIARMDQDDISSLNRLKTQYDFLKLHPEVAIVGNDIIIIDENDNIVGKRTYPTSSNQLKKIMFRYSPFAHPTVMFRKEPFQLTGGYDPAKYPCEDIDFWFRLGRKYKFASIPYPIFKYRVVKTSSSHSNILNTEIMGFSVKINAIKKYGYKPNLYDFIYNILQFITAWLMPPRKRIWLYNFLRTKKLI